MQFREASRYVMPFGKHAGKALDEIASTDAGLKYLDWLRNERAEDDKNAAVDRALAAYLDDPTIKRELESIQ